ncbi:MAG: OmpH family outer membrane protein [Bacteroidales bacterium]|jgi:outer membrane protein|nr:OmpH family outer membrane protein [Bacteroidales bacterium]
MKIKTILCIALAAAFAVSCNQKTNNTTVSEGQTSAPQAGSIVYIQLDSIVAKFDMFNDLKSELEEKVQKIQNDLQAKGRAFERDIKDFQNKIQKGLMTQSEAEEKNRVLGNRQADLQNLSAQKEAEIQEENAVMMNKVMDAIETFVKKYNEEKKYALILTGVFQGDPNLDITNDIIEGLNEEYIKNKKKAVSSETETETKAEEKQAK